MYRATHFNSAFGTNLSARSLGSLWRKQRGLCVLSGEKLTITNAELDHIAPKSRGGTHELSNLRWLSKRINRLKRNYSDSEFIALCGAVIEHARKRAQE